MKKIQNNNDHVDRLLKNIQTVRAPDFMMTRIRAGLEESTLQIISPSWLLSSLTALCLLFAVNYWVISSHVYPSSNLKDFVQEMELLETESFY